MKDADISNILKKTDDHENNHQFSEKRLELYDIAKQIMRAQDNETEQISEKEISTKNIHKAPEPGIPPWLSDSLKQMPKKLVLPIKKAIEKLEGATQKSCIFFLAPAGAKACSLVALAPGN